MRAYLQLVRLPNVFTAMADIFLGFLLTHAPLDPWPEFVLLLLASSSLYLAGMVLNDVFDVRQDTSERPFRPIPSGRVAWTTARTLGAVLLAVGVGLGWAASIRSGDMTAGVVATLLAGCVVLYDSVLKSTPIAPLAMGACRFFNVLLGASTAVQSWPPLVYVAAAGVGIYIVGVTLFARTEARRSRRPHLAAGVVILLAGVVLLASLPTWATGNEWPAVNPPERWYVFWALLGLSIAWRLVRAVIDPVPALVQAGVKNCIFSLIVLDAAACLVVQDIFWGVAILLLLIPTMTLGRWIYST